MSFVPLVHMRLGVLHLIHLVQSASSVYRAVGAVADSQEGRFLVQFHGSRLSRHRRGGSQWQCSRNGRWGRCGSHPAEGMEQAIVVAMDQIGQCRCDCDLGGCRVRDPCVVGCRGWWPRVLGLPRTLTSVTVARVSQRAGFLVRFGGSGLSRHLKGVTRWQGSQDR